MSLKSVKYNWKLLHHRACLAYLSPHDYCTITQTHVVVCKGVGQVLWQDLICISNVNPHMCTWFKMIGILGLLKVIIVSQKYARMIKNGHVSCQTIALI